MPIEVKEVVKEQVVKKTKKIYVTSDGREFSNKMDAHKHEADLELQNRLKDLSEDEIVLMKKTAELLGIQSGYDEFNRLSGNALYAWMLKKFELNAKDIGPYLGYCYWDGGCNWFFLKDKSGILQAVQEKLDSGYDEGYCLTIYDIINKKTLDIIVTDIEIEESELI